MVCSPAEEAVSSKSRQFCMTYFMVLIFGKLKSGQNTKNAHVKPIYAVCKNTFFSYGVVCCMTWFSQRNYLIAATPKVAVLACSAFGLIIIFFWSFVFSLCSLLFVIRFDFGVCFFSCGFVLRAVEIQILRDQKLYEFSTAATANSSDDATFRRECVTFFSWVKFTCLTWSYDRHKNFHKSLFFRSLFLSSLWAQSIECFF